MAKQPIYLTSDNQPFLCYSCKFRVIDRQYMGCTWWHCAKNIVRWGIIKECKGYEENKGVSE